MIKNLSRIVVLRQAVNQISKRNLNSNIPKIPVVPPKFEGDIKISEETILHLERLSLVDFANVKGVRRLEEAIEFAQPLREVNTDVVEPMFTVLDDATLYLAEDEIGKPCSRSDILSNAKFVEEDYFVAPPGNIPLKQDPNRYSKTKK